VVRFCRTGDPQAREEALNAYRTGRQAWAILAEKGVVYAADTSYGPQPWLRGHWLDRLPAIDQDQADIEKARPEAAGGNAAQAIAVVRACPKRAAPACHHVSAKTFRPGEPLGITLSFSLKDRQVSLSDITVGENPQLRGHWLARLPAIDADIAAVAAKVQGTPAGDTVAQVSAATREALLAYRKSSAWSAGTRICSKKIDPAGFLRQTKQKEAKALKSLPVDHPVIASCLGQNGNRRRSSYSYCPEPHTAAHRHPAGRLQNRRGGCGCPFAS
jgi:hypothetical protein